MTVLEQEILEQAHKLGGRALGSLHGHKGGKARQAMLTDEQRRAARHQGD
jgi:hypothetical protein